MSKNTQTRTVKISINLPMEFPEDWDDEMISGGCICGICNGEVEQNENSLPPCKSCSDLKRCKMFLKNPQITVECNWYGWLKNKIGDGKNENLL